MRRRLHPQKWFAERGSLSQFEAALREEWDRNASQKGRAYLHIGVLFAAAGLAWLFVDGTARLSPDYLVHIPATLPIICLLAAAVALALWLPIWRGVRPAFLGRAAMYAWIAMIPICFLYVSLALAARGAVQAEAAVRAQISGYEGTRRGPFRSGSTILALQDGSSVRLSGTLGNRYRCLQVRRITGRFGFQWLRVEASSPAPGPGQLNWPIARDACFSDRPLATLRG